MSAVQQIQKLVESRDLVWNLTLRELRAKYRRSFLGWTWSLLNPLTLVLTYGFVFGVVLGADAPVGDPSGLKNFALYLLTGVLPWGFFTLIAGQGLIALTSNAGLVRKVAFPRETLVVAQSLFSLIQFSIEMVVLNIVMVAFGVNVLVRLPATLFLMIFLAIFATGIAFVLAAIGVYFRDLPYLWQVVVQIYFFMTPILYNQDLLKDRVPSAVFFVLTWNPMAVFVSGFRDSLYNASNPPGTHLVVMAFSAAVSLLIGLTIFGRLNRRFAEEL